jgi:hypothetical protein
VGTPPSSASAGMMMKNNAEISAPRPLKNIAMNLSIRLFRDEAEIKVPVFHHSKA